MPKKQTTQTKQSKPDPICQKHIEEYEREKQNLAKISEICQKKLESYEKVGANITQMKEDYCLLKNVQREQEKESEFFLGKAKTKRELGLELKGSINHLKVIFNWFWEVLRNISKAFLRSFSTAKA
jgi:predicted RNase H-like nuclease (RuvC/YqgF family)